MLSSNESAARSQAEPTPKKSAKSATLALPVDGRTLPHAYLRRVETSGTQRLFRLKREGRWIDITWNEAHAQVLGIFDSLRKLGIKNGDRVGIMSQSRPEWNLTDIAVQAVGATAVPIYHSNSVEDTAFILENCEAKLIFTEDEGLCQKLAEVYTQTKRKVPIIVYSAKMPSVSGLDIKLYSDFAKPAPEAESEFRKSVDKITPEMIASIVYTSGTTGRPKGAVLPHSCFTSEMRSIIHEIALYADDITVTFLPFAHVLGRIESYMPIFSGISLGFAESINSVALNITEVKPTLLVSVPRIYEKIYAKIMSEVESQPQMKRNIFKWAVNVGREVAKHRAAKTPIPLWMHLKYLAADQLVFNKIRAKLGGNIRMTVSGGAPLSPELCEIFHACGIKILEGYGLTETTAAICVNRPDDYEFGTVGRMLPGIEVRIAEDGEIQLHGGMIFKEYLKNPEATKEVFTSDGWFCTGDIGEITARGNLKITDRKKELIVTSGGKKIAPQKLENMIKSSRFMSNGMVYGDKQKYLIALITLNEPEIKTWAKTQGISSTSMGELAQNAKVNDLIDGELKKVNAQLASYESIKKFKILPIDFTVEGGELTPSLKIKRRVLTERYRTEIDSLF